MMNRKTVTLINTFDYELFLGNNSGTVENCLIKPTSAVLPLLSSHDIKAIFFVDATYLYRLKSCAEKFSAAEKDYGLIREQLHEVASLGHNIYLHIHPHWMDAVYDNISNTWSLQNKNHFSFHNLAETERKNIFEKAFSTLTEILPVNHAIEGFRAGGLYIQPFSVFKPYFTQFRLYYDFSVLRGAMSKGAGNLYGFDFTDHPKHFIYNFEDDILVEEPNGAFKEISINLVELKNFRKILNAAFYRFTRNTKQFKKFGDGTASGNIISATKKGSFRSKLFVKETLSIESLNPVKVPLYFLLADTDRYLHFISHPKLITRGGIASYDRLLKKLKNKFDLTTDLKKILLNQTL